MPRLILVDDNPSIHKIAETLLAASPIELVCVDSAAAALERVNRGEHFDVALVDTSMAGMDGWGLLAKLRENPATARMPIAMMAGVLDTVDPERIKEAPIQGFLKKPVELRDLGDRITHLLEVPVPILEPPPLPPPMPKAPSPFATMPAVRLEDLPEFRKREELPLEAAPEPEPEVQPESTDDLLELTEEDLYPETVTEKAAANPTEEETLDLEELDLESLRGLSVASEEAVSPTPPLMTGFQALDEPSEPTPPSSAFPAEQLDAIATLDRLPQIPAKTPEAPISDLEIMEVDLPDLGSGHEDLLEASTLSDLPEIEEIVTTEQPTVDAPSLAEYIELPKEEVGFTPPLPPLEESLDWSDDSESMLAVMEQPPVPAAEAVVPAMPVPEDELDLLDMPVPELSHEPAPTLELEDAPPVTSAETEISVVAPPMAVPAAAPIPTEAIVESALLETAAAPQQTVEAAPAPTSPKPTEAVQEMLDSMMADPALMDSLAKAVVARLGDQILREIAWEVIPGLAERFPRN